MQGTYNFGSVLLSYLIACLAAYVAIEFAGRIWANSRRRARWLAGGALVMGSGIWSMHFVGMGAFELPVEISYDLGLTAFSWLCAVAVSGLALAVLGFRRLTGWTLAAAALLMGAGISAMHYAGMWAMRMDPGIDYEPLLVAASVLVAVAASAAALLIISYLREVRSWRDIGLRMLASLVMGLAVAGMHYTGMAAARFAPEALCAPGNLLRGDWMVAPTSFAALLVLALGLWMALSDARSVARRRAREVAEAARLEQLAFVDPETALPNRSRFSQLLSDALTRNGTSAQATLVSLRVEVGGLTGEQRSALLRSLVDRLSARIGNATMARGGAGQLLVLFDTAAQVVESRHGELLRSVLVASGAGPDAVTAAQYPDDGSSASMLLFRCTSRPLRQVAAEPVELTAPT